MTDVANDTNELSGIPERFEVYSSWGHKTAGLGGIFLLSAFILGLGFCLDSLIPVFHITLYSFLHLNWEVFGFLSGFILILFPALFSADIIVQLYRFNLGRKIVVEKKRLTVGGRSWDAQSLIECIDVSVKDGTKIDNPFDGKEFNPYTFHEYAVCDNNGKMIAYFDERYRNSEQLKRWLQEGGCKLTHRDGKKSFLCHLRKLY